VVSCEEEEEEEDVKALEARSASEPGKAEERMCCSGMNVVVGLKWKLNSHLVTSCSLYFGGQSCHIAALLKFANMEDC